MLHDELAKLISLNDIHHKIVYKNSSKDEIVNVNIFTVISHTYFKIPKKRTYFERIVRLVSLDNVAWTLLLVWTGLYSPLLSSLVDISESDSGASYL